MFRHNFSTRSLITLIKPHTYLLAVGVGTLAALAGYWSLRIPLKSYIIFLAIVFLLPITLRFDFFLVLFIYVGFSGILIGANYYFLSPFLYGATVWEVSIYLGLLAFLCAPFGDFRKRWDKLISTPMLLPQMGFVIFALVAFLANLTTWNVETFLFLRKTVFYGLAIYLLITNIIRKPKEAVYLLMALTVGNTMMTTWLSFNIAGSWDILSRIELGRSAGYSAIDPFNLGRGGVTLGEYIGMLLPLAITLALNNKQRWRIFMFAGVSVLLGWMLVLTESRSAMVAGLTSVVFVILLSSNRKIIPIWKVAVIGILMVAVVVVFLNSGLLGQGLSSRLETFNYLSTDPSYLSRLYLWQNALKILASNPFGVGFSYFTEQFGFAPHNDYLNIALGSGFLGLFCFVAFLLGLVSKFLKGAKQADRDTQIVCIAALGCCIVYAVNAVTSHVSQNTWAWQVFWIALATAMGALRSAAANHPEQSQHEKV